MDRKTVALTTRGEYDSEGACTLRHRHMTAVYSVMDGRDQISTTEALYGSAIEFEMALEVQQSHGGEGLGFAYGELRKGGLLSPLGAGHGLRVQLHSSTYPWAVAVMYDGVPLVRTEVPVNATGRFVLLEISYGRAAHGGTYAGLTVRYDGITLLRGMLIDAWSPQPSWRFGVSARSGTGRDADCMVRDVQLRAGGSAEPLSTPLVVARNGHEFLTPAPRPYIYYAAPIISAITPASGPLLGGTRILISGQGLHGGSAYSCRLGAGEKLDGRLVDGPTTVTPDQNTTRAKPFLHCTTPPAAAPGVLMPQVSLNGQDETNSTVVPFRYYDPPALLGMSPTSGPALGGTRVELTGANFTSADANGTTHPATAPLRVCRYGDAMWSRAHGALSLLMHPSRVSGPYGVSSSDAHGLAPNEVPATVVNDSLAVCVSPPSLSGGREEVAVELSLNGHDFTSSGAQRHQYYAEVRTHHSRRGSGRGSLLRGVHCPH